MFAIDTNILAYAAFASPDPRKAVAAQLVSDAALADAILPIQVLIEFANAALKRRQLPVADARCRIAEWSSTFTVIESCPADVLSALDLVTTRQLSWFDALIIATAQRAGASILLTEDMQDGADFDGLRIINPFAPHNSAAVQTLLAG